MYKKIFISYAREDFQVAEDLYNFLVESGFEPWMDKKLLPGQNWDFLIQQSLREADFILLLLSSTSVNKRGYVQKEFNQAVIYCDEKLDSDIYVIPVKLDACEVPKKLTKFQWAEYSSVDFKNRILEAINLQRSILIKQDESRKNLISGFDYENKMCQGEHGAVSPKQIWDIKFFRFNRIENESLKEINTLIEYDVLSGLMMCRNNYFNNLKDFKRVYYGEGSGLFETDSAYYAVFNLHLFNKSFVSYTSFCSVYFSGAAHGNYGTTGANYLINPLRPLKLDDLFENYHQSLSHLRDCVHKKLMAKAKNEYEEDVSGYFYLYEEGLQAERKHFDNYYFKNNCIVFVYNPYELTAYALGDHHIEIKFDELISLFPNEFKLHKFIKLIQSA